MEDYPDERSFPSSATGSVRAASSIPGRRTRTIRPKSRAGARVGKQKIEDTGPLTKKRMETCDDEFVASAKEFIKQPTTRASRSSSGSTSPTCTSTRTPSPRAKARPGAWQSPYHDTMIDHDKNVGQMLDELDELGIADDTFVMYSTDNGPHLNSWPDGAMTPFRSEKNTNWEGAFRIPLLVRWPGKIKPGRSRTRSSSITTGSRPSFRWPATPTSSKS